MADLTRDDILKLAALARLQLDDREVDAFAVELTEILHYVEQLKDIDVTGLQPTHQVTGLTNIMRADVPADYGYEPATLLENVPQVQDGQLKVRRMIG